MIVQHSLTRGRVWTTAVGIVFMLGISAKAAAADIETKTVEFRGGSGQVKGYLAKPKGEGPFPGIVVVHEWWGLSDWIKQDCEKLAGQGYVALAVDLYRGEATNDPNKAHELMRALNQSEAVADLKGGATHLTSLPYVAKNEKLGVIG
ncbi:MAG TPA: dienelactone hydrolase family protein, partial [Isosphaeraceae bacterium]|nr:dienelactone hydrolase family protein [Isosphaeraceae bacterium]